jgi:hypothetical protein
MLWWNLIWDQAVPKHCLPEIDLGQFFSKKHRLAKHNWAVGVRKSGQQKLKWGFFQKIHGQVKLDRVGGVRKIGQQKLKWGTGGFEGCMRN